MEVKSPVFSTWKFFLLGLFCGGVLFILFSDRIQQDTSLLDAQNNAIVVVDQPISITKPTKFHSNVTNNVISPPTLLEPNVTLLSVLGSRENRTKKAKTMGVDCNMFEGRWVYEPDAKPAYDATTCPLLETAVSCQENGRPDSEYVKWRWEARDCDIPLFDGKDMLQRLRNKRVTIVGDSLNRNMFESLACLIYTSVPSSRAEIFVKKGAYKALKAKDYNLTVEFYMSPFLTELSLKHKSGRKVLILDKISSFANQWKGADVMVFNSGHWWTHNNNMKAWDLFQYKEELIEDMPRDLAYKRAMRTWASWIKKNVETEKTHVFFRSVSPSHNRRKSDQWCYNATTPMVNESYVTGFPKNLVDVTEKLMRGMKKLNVKYLNITNMSQHRNDAHPSIFTSDLKTVNKKEYENLLGNVDCNHWCLPGLPDTWNRLLYASIFSNTNAN